MLDLMRKHARNWMMKVILGIVILVFIFYFGSLGGRRKAETVAIIDGRAIGYTDYLREYQNLVDLYQQRFEGRLTADVMRGLNLKQQTLDALVDQAIIQQKARELHIEVASEEVRSAILSSPLFQRGGGFDEQVYQYFLRSHRMTSEEMEDHQKKFLTAVRIEDIIGDSVKVSDKELYDLYRLQNEKINVEFLALHARDFERLIEPSARDLEDYLKEHGKDFRIPEQIEIRYLAFFGQDYATSVQITEAEINDYYDQHKSKWSTQGKTSALSDVKGQIVRELRQKKGMYAAAAESKKAHDTIYQEENFDAYAAANRLRIYATDFFPQNAPPPEISKLADFAKEVFHLQKDEISPVLTDEKGYYLFKVGGRKPAYIPALKDVEKTVEKHYREERARQLCRESAEAILARLKKGEDIGSIAQREKLHLMESGLFLPGSSVPKIGLSQELSEALYSLSAKRPYPDRAFEVSGNLIVVKFKEKETIDDSAFLSQKGELKKIAMTMKKSEIIRSWLQENKASLVTEGRLKFTKEIKDL